MQITKKLTNFLLCKSYAFVFTRTCFFLCSWTSNWQFIKKKISHATIYIFLYVFPFISNKRFNWIHTEKKLAFVKNKKNKTCFYADVTKRWKILQYRFESSNALIIEFFLRSIKNIGCDIRIFFLLEPVDIFYDFGNNWIFLFSKFNFPAGQWDII